MRVKKYSGELVDYNPNSLKQSLSKSGASSSEVSQVFKNIEHQLFDGISTRELYEIAFSCLKNVKNTFAARYSLKKALRDLGPDGFYFEKWVAKIYHEDGYQALTGQTLQGHAVTHEIDVIAVKENKLLAIECKFRNDIDAKISVTTPMYFMSRIIDLQDLSYPFFGQELKITEGWLVTNAYFTSDSIKFAEYHKMNLLSWDYPEGHSLKVKVDNNGEYPITCLTSLTDENKSKLLKKQCILVKDILREPKYLQDLTIDNDKKNKVLLEATELIESPLEHD